MTAQDIDNAFKIAIENNELKQLKLSKFIKYNLENKPCSTARKLEILWMLDKIKLK